MKKQDELRGQIATMKVAASALIDSGKVAEAKEEIAKMKSIQEQITLLDQLDSDFAAQASAAEGTGVTAAAASGKPAGNDAVKAFAAAARIAIGVTEMRLLIIGIPYSVSMSSPTLTRFLASRVTFS